MDLADLAALIPFNNVRLSSNGAPILLHLIQSGMNFRMAELPRTDEDATLT